MVKPALFLFLLLLTLTAQAAPRPPLALTLPSADTYCYWVQSKDGPVGTLPVTVTHAKTVQAAAPMTTGDIVFVMDAHTGEVASHPVSIDLSGAPLPMKLVLADFKPIYAPAPAAPVSAQIAPAESKPNGVQRLLTTLFSLALLGGVVWIVLQLIKTRGEPLRQLARRAGIEVPDPHAAAEDTSEEPPVYASEKRAPDAVPESAGLPPKGAYSSDPHSNNGHSVIATLGRGPALPLSEVPALLGLQGLAAGSTFALTDGDVTVGRDGDNEIVLAENTVSRRHARLLRDSHGQFTLSDLGSANGVYINGTRIQRAILSAGDEIKIGDNYFRFQAAKENL